MSTHLADRPLETADDARRTICLLGQRFYDLGWVSGTGGGIAIRLGERVFMAPSGVQKELLEPADIYELDLEGEVVVDSAAPGTKVSACRPLFLAAMQMRGAGAVIHSHSQNAALATMLFDKAFAVTHLEMMKGIAQSSGMTGYHDLHEVPIIDNTAHEADLADSLKAAIDAYPSASAVLVRRHGVYVWGADWRAAKRHAECYDYLFGLAVEMKRLGIDPSVKPGGAQ